MGMEYLKAIDNSVIRYQSAAERFHRPFFSKSKRISTDLTKVEIPS